MSKPQIVIVGAGPAGMVLAYQLVSNGVPVRVLEQHPDLEREFRGELLGPSVLPALESLGILPMLTERGFARTGVERRMFVGPKRRVMLPGGAELGAQISQAGLLALLHELCSRHAHYQLDFKATALFAVREGGRVVALAVRREGREERVEGDVFVVCNGRNSRLRKDLGIELELSEKPDSTLWLRFDFDDAPEALPRTVDVHMFGKGVVVVHFATAGRPRLQIAYSAPGDVGALRKDLPALRERLLPTLPERLRELVAAKIDDRMESQVLAVAIDRLKTWHVPGMLFLGDAAHTMSPAGGQGLNLAIRDSIVAANHMIDAVRAGAPIDAEVFARIEGERRPEIEAAQAGQLRAYRMVHKPLFIEHLMFTLLGVVMRFKTFAIAPSAPVEPRHAVRATPAT
jgi:2-polyprenyl-6-methoxyphenol hydroxylase-like FAD-dependent oxidoreductase